MKFNIDNYKGKYVMHCKTEEEAREFCNYLHSIGRKWCSGESYLGDTFYEHCQTETAYRFNAGEYAHVSYYKANNFTILEFSDFDWSKEFTKSDLKTGDVILRRDGAVEIVNRELEMFIGKDEWDDLDDILDNLRDIGGKNEYDIMAVRRPKVKSDCNFRAFQYEWGTLVYERKEPEEMTLAEVCKLLGKEIIIIP